MDDLPGRHGPAPIGSAGEVITLSFASRVRSSRDVVWAAISTMDGVDAELRPILRMTYPSGVELVGEDLEPGFCFHSWLLLGGVVPIDRHSLTIERLVPGVGFDEESTSWLQRRWRHERRITDEAGGGCLVTDRLVVEPRLRFTEPVAAFVVRRVFDHRHRRLRRQFGASPCPTDDVSRSDVCVRWWSTKVPISGPTIADTSENVPAITPVMTTNRVSRYTQNVNGNQRKVLVTPETSELTINCRNAGGNAETSSGVCAGSGGAVSIGSVMTGLVRPFERRSAHDRLIDEFCRSMRPRWAA